MKVYGQTKLFAWRGSQTLDYLLLLAQVAIVLLVYPLLHSLYFQVASLPEKAYFTPILAVQIFNQPSGLLIWLFILMAVLFLGYRRLHWKGFEQGQLLKYFIFTLTLIITWAFATYDYNLYYNHAHYVDRFVLILLALLVWFSPVFIPLFLTQAIIIVSQFEYPLGSYSWTDKRIIFDILILFNIFLYLKLGLETRFFKKTWFLKSQTFRPFLFLALCFFAANYFISGLAKLELDWVNKNRIYELVIASYANGWLAFLPERALLNLVDTLKRFNFFMLLMTMIVELGALAILFHKWVALLLLSGFILLHGMIFITTGIFFWKWIMLAMAFILVLRTLHQTEVKQLFSKSLFLTSLFIIYFSPGLFDPVELAWYDTNLNVSYELEAVGQSGAVYQVGRSFMSPYDFPFAQNRFWYLSNEKLLVGTYGATSDAEIAKGLKAVKSGEELGQLEMTRGRNRYDEKKAKKFEYFLQTYFENLNHRQSKTIFINYLAAPPHIWNFTQGNSYDLQERVQKIRVKFIKTFYDGQKIHTLKNELLRVLDIPASRQTTFGQVLTLLGTDIYLELGDMGEKKLFINSYWRVQADLQPDFDIQFTIHQAETGQIIKEWVAPYTPDAQESWKFGQVVNVVHHFDLEGKFDGHYHLDIGLRRRADDSLVQLENSSGSQFIRIENIQDKITIREE